MATEIPVKTSDRLTVTKLEKDRREQARRHYRYFRHYVDPKFEDGRHNLYLAEKLEQVEAFIRTKGKEGINRLIVVMPPQYGKTKDVARTFPAYVLGRNQNAHIGIISYGADLADKHSAAVRDMVMGQYFQNLFGVQSSKSEPIEVADDSAAKNDWSLAGDSEGGCISRGTGGGLSGHPLDLLIIDDPTKDIDEARSQAHQSKLENWFDSVAVPRLSEFGAIVIVHTRWDPNDLIGQQLKKMASGDPRATKWEVIHFPALALESADYPKTDEEFTENLRRGYFIPKDGDQLGREPGEPLWPWRYSLDYVDKIKANTSPYVFTALHQGLPRPLSGGFFDDPDIKEIGVGEVPENLTWCAYIDLALGNSKTSDWNAVMPETLDPETGRIIGRDLIHEHELRTFLQRVKIAMLLPENRKVIWGVESVAFQTLVFQEFMKDPTLAGVAIVRMLPTESKNDRAAKLSLRAKEGLYCWVKGPWTSKARRELLEFPTGDHDDIVDTCSGGLYMIAKHSQPKRAARSYEG
jgi:phage terminase large subunit-like protein